MSKPAFHALSIKESLTALKTSEAGLDHAEANKRLEKYGKNEFQQFHRCRAIKILWDQFSSVLVLILILAATLSLFLGEVFDAIAIFAVLILNAVLGFIQEYKAEKALEELEKIETLEARVLRNGQEETLDASLLVPGDIILLYEGEKVPADARVLESVSLEVDESMLTGESLPVYKQIKKLDEEFVLAERKNIIYSASMIVRGHGKAVVIDTGMNTEIGKIASQVQVAKDEATPLQETLDGLGKKLALLAIGMALPVLIIALLKGENFFEVLMMGISLAVSSIPEGLPVVVTVALALGVKRMVSVNVLTKKLPAVESLGGIDVICTDKTGTITQNKMKVASVFLPKFGFFTFPKDLKDVKVNEELNKKFDFKSASKEDRQLLSLMEEAVLCSDARDDFGDPTEKALVQLLEAYAPHSKILEKYQRFDEIPFSSEKKFMVVAVENKKEKRAIIKGAPEVLFNMCKLSKKEIRQIREINEDFAERGLRVLAVANKKIKKDQPLAKVDDYQFLGLLALQDPPRTEVAAAIKKCHRAGVRTIMITGDHKKTAQAIGKMVGLNTEKAYTGKELDQMTEEELAIAVDQAQIFARVSPENKVQILQALQKKGLQVAMTGDGVNDAPALKKAEIGIAVGSGTALSKDVADVILLNDNFASIIDGIEEGRHIFFNIKKFVRFLLSANFDEILCVAAAILLGMPLVFLPIHVLWLNLVTDSFPALALSNDVADPEIMKKKPYHPRKEILSGVLPHAMLSGAMGFFVTFLTFSVMLYYFKASLPYVRTMSFSAMVFYELFMVFAVRTNGSAIKMGLFSNKILVLAVLFAFGLQLAAIYLPFMQNFLKTESLELGHLLVVLLFSSMGFWMMELTKWWMRKDE